MAKTFTASTGSKFLALVAALTMLLGIAVFAQTPAAKAQTEQPLSVSSTTNVAARTASMRVYSTNILESGTVTKLVVTQPGTMEPTITAHYNEVVIGGRTLLSGDITQYSSWNAAERTWTISLPVPVSVTANTPVSLTLQWRASISTAQASASALTVLGTKPVTTPPPPPTTAEPTPPTTTEPTPPTTTEPTPPTTTEPTPPTNPTNPPATSEPTTITPGVVNVPLPISNQLGTDGTLVTLDALISADPTLSQATIKIDRTPTNGSKMTNIQSVFLDGVALSPSEYTLSSDGQSITITINGRPITDSTSLRVVLRTDKMDAAATYTATVSTNQTQTFPPLNDPSRFLNNNETLLNTSVTGTTCTATSTTLNVSINNELTTPRKEIGSFIIRNINGAVADGASLSTNPSDYTIRGVLPGATNLVVREVDVIEKANDSIVTAVRVWFSLSSSPTSFHQITRNPQTYTISGNFRRGGSCPQAGNYEVYGATRIPAGSGYNPGTPTPAIPTQCVRNSNIEWMGNGSEVVQRLAPRELTEEEISRGSAAYVVVGVPSNAYRTSSQLSYQLNAATNFQNIGPRTGWVYNAMAYNPQDNWLYAISQPRYPDTSEDPCFPAGHLLQINPVTGEVHNLGKVTGSGPSGYGFGGIYLTRENNDLWGGINVGFIDQQGVFWVTNSSISGTGVMYQVDISAVTAQAMDPIKAFGSTGARSYNSPWTVASEDFTLLPFSDGQYAWGLTSRDTSGNNTTRTYMERLNLATGRVDRFDVTNLTNDFGQRIPQEKIWGKAWFYGNGNLGFGTGSSGADVNLVQIRVTNPTSSTPTFQLVTVRNNAPTGYNTDGAAVIVPVRPDLELKKDFMTVQNGRVNWRITLTNRGPGTSSGALVEDLLNTAFGNVRLDSISASDPQTRWSQTLNGNNFQVNFGVLPEGATATIWVSATSPTVNSCIENVSTVTGLDIDLNIANNTASDHRCSVNVQKNVVDQNGDGVITGEDGNLRNPDGTFALEYDLVVSGPNSGFTQAYTLVDVPQFTHTVEVLGAQVVSATSQNGNANNVLPPRVQGRTFTVPVPADGWQIVTTQDGARVSPGATHTYRIRVNYRITGDLNAPNANKECEAGVPNGGLYNTVKITSGGITTEDNDCAPLTTDDGVNLAVEKVGYSAEDSSTGPVVEPITEGVEFTIFGTDANLGLDQDQVVTKMSTRLAKPGDPGAGYYTAALRPDTYYYLVETKAPAGYNLLAQPVLFKIVWDAQGIQRVKFYDPNTQAELPNGDGLVGIYANGTRDSAAVAFMQVADVRKGDLPRTGGLGFGPWVALGLLIAALGAVAVRRA